MKTQKRNEKEIKEQEIIQEIVDGILDSARIQNAEGEIQSHLMRDEKKNIIGIRVTTRIPNDIYLSSNGGDYWKYMEYTNTPAGIYKNYSSSCSLSEDWGYLVLEGARFSPEKWAGIAADAAKIFNGEEACNDKETFIITRHESAVDWLRSKGIEGKTVSQYQDLPDTLQAGDSVYGVLPINLWAELQSQGIQCYQIVFPQLPASLRGQELTIELMNKHGAKLIRINQLEIEIL